MVICGNTLTVLRAMKSESIDTILTSPPYWGLRDYGKETRTIWGGDRDCKHKWIFDNNIKDNLRFRKGKNTTVGNFLKEEIYSNKKVKSAICKKCGAWYGQLGLEPNLDMYIEHLLQITKELKRVLKKTGVIFWNHGDCYGGASGYRTEEEYKKYLEKYPNGKDGKARFFDRPNTKYKAKCMALQNYRFILRCVDELGLILRNIIIWYKPNAMPSSVKDRLANVYEPVFMLTKSKHYYFDLDAIREPLSVVSIQRAQYGWNETKQEKAGLGGTVYHGFTQPKLEKWRQKYLKPNYQGKFAGFGEKSEQFGSPRARTERQSKSKFIGSNVKTASPGARRILTVLEGKLTTQVKKRILNVGVYLKQQLKNSGLNTQKLADMIDVKETTIAHYFRTDFSSQALPNRQTWEQLKSILNLGNYDDFIDEEIRTALPQPHPAGKNPGDMWEIATHPFSGAHLAVFPEALVIKPIKAGCPKWICKKCGKARVRLTEHKSNRPTNEKYSSGFDSINPNKSYYFGEARYKTIGWTDCGCNAGFEPGIILDPFCGSGTVGVVAYKLGRRFIGIDLSYSYCVLSKKRIQPYELQTNLFTSIKSLSTHTKQGYLL